MPRPLSWLPRLHEIRRAVAGSARSHYSRQDLETLFELQPRSAQKLIEMLPSVAVGTSRLVEREALERFLNGVHGAADVPAYLETVRSEKARVSRRKLRSLVRADLPAADLASLPEAIRLSRGRLEIHFGSLEELAEAMLTVARLLEGEGEAFAREFEPEPLNVEPEVSGEVGEMFRELEEMERLAGPGQELPSAASTRSLP